MEVMIAGNGKMATAIGIRAAAGRHSVRVVGRSPERTEACAGRIREAAPEASVSAGALDGELGADVIVLALFYPEIRKLVSTRSTELAGKVAVDISNPINDTYDGLLVPADSSAARELAAIAPDVHFVKAFNTTFAGPLAAGEAAGEPLDVLLAGDDDGAKHAVTALARDGGLNPIDTGPLERARELEALGLLHITLQDALGTPFNTAVRFVSAAG